MSIFENRVLLTTYPNANNDNDVVDLSKDHAAQIGRKACFVGISTFHFHFLPNPSEIFPAIAVI
jgi:hypothetical protein